MKSEQASFKWGTESGSEFVEMEPRVTLLSEHSLNEEMCKHSERGRRFADSHHANLNNRVALFCW